MSKRVPHPKNAPGDFYVEDGCCISCAVPHAEAPDLFKFEEVGKTDSGATMAHCYVCKQPSTEAEVVKMANAMSVQEVDCIRYKGSEQKVIAILRRQGMGEYIDA